MKALIVCLTCVFVALATHGYAGTYADSTIMKTRPDSVKLKADSSNAYYQKVVNVDNNITEGIMYGRVLQFMAAKNIQQTYGYQEEGKLIFTTTQDLNINRVYVGDDNDIVDPYTVQFAITLDLKNKAYRYTIHNVVFFTPSATGNKRETLYDVYTKATNTDSRRVAKNAKKLIESFERYITTLTNELYQGVEQKTAIYNSKF